MDWKNKDTLTGTSFKKTTPSSEAKKKEPPKKKPVQSTVTRQPIEQQTIETTPQKKPKGWLPLLLLLLVALVLAALLLLPRLTQKSTLAASSEASSEEASSAASQSESAFILPDVVGMSEDAACKALSVDGLTINIRYQYDSNAKTGVILEQTPAAGTEWSGGSVDLVVCDRTLGMNSVPNVVGMRLSAAKEALEDAGFVAGVRLDGNESAVVTAQTPAADTKAEKGCSVTLSYERQAASEAPASVEIEKHPTAASSSSTASRSPSSSTSRAQSTQQQSTQQTEHVTPPAQETQPAQPAQPVQTVSAYIGSCTKNLIQFVTSGGNATISVEYVYPSGAHSQRFALGTYSDGVHEFSPGVSITDPRGTYQVCLYDSNGNLLATSSFTN